MSSRKPIDSRSVDANAPRPAEDERHMLERELAGVRPWRRGANRISAVDFEDVPRKLPSSPTRRSGSPTGRAGGKVELQPDGETGMAFGVSSQTLAELRRGELGFEARCDLHKLHAEAARRKLVAFVHECARRNLRAGLVICGRGLHSGPDGPVLAKIVAETLARAPTNQHILAFAPAARERGGAGAIAILFRRRSARDG